MALQCERFLLIFLCTLFSVVLVKGQVVYYPQNSSDLLKSTAADLADLLGRSIPTNTFHTAEYNGTPLPNSISLFYDSSITAGQVCKITGNQYNLIFRAAEDNGLNFGIYKYLYLLGFKFYLPGTIWETIPLLTSPYSNIDTTVHGVLKYNGWTISGGQNRWAMDNDDSYGWDIYYGKNGHEWAKYQRRNNMNGSNRFSGHRGDILTTSYIATLQANPCYVACFDQNRQAGMHAVPDINNIAAKDLWSAAIKNHFISFQNIIRGNPVLYKNYFHNLNYTNDVVGIEVPDGAHWGNSIDNNNCNTGNFNGKPYPKYSDQQFLLANHCTQAMVQDLPGLRYQCYAYADHADIPSPNISLSQKLDIQVVPAAFQFETSSACLLNRWYNRYPAISEYHYLNIPQWTGEAPVFSLMELKNSWRRIKEKHSQGMILEASPAKFASLPFLFAGNRFLMENIDVDSSLNEFVHAMFPSGMQKPVRNLLTWFGDNNINFTGNFISDNKCKLPLYLNELLVAVNIANQDSTVAKRLREIKSYLHYLVLYYAYINAGSSVEKRYGKAVPLCAYLAKINKLQLVNSYFLIQNTIAQFPASNNIHTLYDVINGTMYINGNTLAINDAEIDSDFNADLSRYGAIVTGYNFKTPLTIIHDQNNTNLKPLDSVHVKVGYTNGYQYTNRCEFGLYAPKAGSISINCIPYFGMAEGYINISVESTDSVLLVLKDIRLDASNSTRSFVIDIPVEGMYKLSFVSKWKTSADITIYTGGNTLFKDGPFYGDKVESYRDDTLSFPRYNFIPKGTQKLYFTINNACSASNCLTASEVGNAFGFRDEAGATLQVFASDFDSSLFIINVRDTAQPHFWQVTKMREYNLSFANITNMELFLTPKTCTAKDFKASVVSANGECHTRISAENGVPADWKITTGAVVYTYVSTGRIDLPVVAPPNAVITMNVLNGCTFSKRCSEIPGYVQSLSNCVSKAPDIRLEIRATPIPSAGIFTFTKNSFPCQLEDIRIYNATGQMIISVKKTDHVDLSLYPPGFYMAICKYSTDDIRIRLVKL